MLTGFNTDFRYKDTVYHVQTEDNGVGNPVIVTLLYRGGAILASRKTSYADILKFDKLEQVVREIMEEQHKQVIKDLVAGSFTAKEESLSNPEMPAPDLSAAPAVKTKAENEAKTAEEAGERPLKEKGLDNEILDYLASEDDWD
jgi:pyruvate/2-oxoglutarate dehydrogenase complex dihydrolipoamide acyltransferase (E2) component